MASHHHHHHHVLLLGGHGKVAQLLTPLLLRRAWHVTSVIRSPEQVDAVRRLGDAAAAAGAAGRLTVLVRSLEEIKSEAEARAVLDEVGADYVVWSAGRSPPWSLSVHGGRLATAVCFGLCGGGWMGV